MKNCLMMDFRAQDATYRNTFLTLELGK